MAIAVVTGGIAIVISNHGHGVGELSPSCVIRRLTGYDCPGCGSQRALDALLHGHIAEAWSYNYALPVLVAVALLYIVSPQRIRGVLYHPATLSALIIAMLGWWVLRNVYHI